MKYALLLALVLIPLCLCACGFGSDNTDGEDPAEAESSISVVCGEDLNLTPASGIKVDWMDLERGWVVTVVGNEFNLTRRSSCGDECGVTEEIVLVSENGECPSVVSARSVLREGMTSRGTVETVTRATIGSLEIQDWDLESGVLSGRLSAEIAFTFYATVEE